jgi:hypothetical protein
MTGTVDFGVASTSRRPAVICSAASRNVAWVKDGVADVAVTVIQFSPARTFAWQNEIRAPSSQFPPREGKSP